MNRSLDQLEAAAAAWLGTPFCEFSAVKGAGVCCHALPLEIYFAAGWLPRFEYPMAAPRAAHVEKVEAFILGDGVAHLTRLSDNLTALPGDTFHFRLGRTSHFMLKLSDRYIHAVHGAGVLYAVSIQPAWLKRLHAIYRPT